MGKTIRAIDESAIAALCAHSWPGNIRELQNVVERAVILARGNVLGPSDFELPGLGSGAPSTRRDRPTDQRQRIEEALAASRGRVYGVEGAAERTSTRSAGERLAGDALPNANVPRDSGRPRSTWPLPDRVGLMLATSASQSSAATEGRRPGRRATPRSCPGAKTSGAARHRVVDHGWASDRRYGPRAAGTFALGLAGLAGVTLVSVWIGFDWALAGLLYLTVITLLSLVSGFLPAFLLSALAVAALQFFFVSPIGSERLGVLDVVELTAFLVVAGVTTRLVSRATQAARQAEARARLLDLTHDRRCVRPGPSDHVLEPRRGEAVRLDRRRGGRIGPDLLQAKVPRDALRVA